LVVEVVLEQTVVVAVVQVVFVVHLELLQVLILFHL
jgi:hypothetical protein